eukprot:TRINITY_DN42335_c0_g1_i1.p1 TRINITY_DN42335_c0_g1~~TRINITY_DN42335_c0_g1_i1.p1  ORF type:complete len:285 (-),score=29.71 TRINITY_DN42335_c0_g1_i1:9-785(-)
MLAADVALGGLSRVTKCRYVSQCRRLVARIAVSCHWTVAKMASALKPASPFVMGQRACPSPVWKRVRLLLRFVLGIGIAMAEPFAEHRRVCVSGQHCAIGALQGTGLGNGDRITLLKNCGTGDIPEGLPAPLGQTLPAVDDGAALRWAAPITLDGGEYRMCWCSAAIACLSNGVSAFATSAGTMTITGPASGLELNCHGGRLCQITGINGVYLRNDDSVMILDGCGVGAGVEGFPNDGKTTTGALQGSEHGWGQATTG